MQVLAVGLGDIKMQSYLNEPLRAEVTLLDVQGLTAEDLRIRLASQSDFDEMGVQRDYFLSQIEFSVIFDSRGAAKVVLTTDAPLLEPYIDFLMEMRWPAGRLLREYTVLVDLPPSQPRTPIVPRSEGRPAPVVVSEPAPERQFVRGERPADRQYDANTRALPEAGDRYLVENNDTLWNIAAAARPSGYSVEQTMIATVDKNPQAFTGRNINGLKAGYVLDLPTGQDMLLSDAEARSEVRQHNSDWRAGIRYQPALRVVAEALPDVVPDESGDDSAEDDIDFEDVAVSDTRVSQTADPVADESPVFDNAVSAGSSAQGNGGLDTVAPTEAQIDLAVIQSQLGQLSEQVQNLRELVSLKDQQIAALEAQLAAQNSTGAPAQAADDAGVAWWWFVLAGILVVALGVLVVLRLRGASSRSVIDQQGLTFDEALAASGEAVAQDGQPDSQVQAPSAVRQAPSAVHQEPSAVHQEPSAVRQEPSALNQAPSAVSRAAPDVAQDSLQAESIQGRVSEDAVPMATTEESAMAQAAASRAEHDAGLSDAIAEAEIYLAYGRHQQAIDLLQAAQKRHPAGARGFVKMIEILVDIDRADEAQALLDQVFELGDASQKQQASTLVEAAMEKRATALPDLGELADAQDLSDLDAADASAIDVLEDDLDMLSADDDDIAVDSGLSLDLDLSEFGDLQADDDALADVEDEDEDTDRLPPELASVLGTEFVSQVPNLGSTDDEDNELVYASEADPMDTKLDLARAYLDMGDEDGARPVLKEVMSAGNLAQQAEARELLQRID
jgi:pilus assembly protein FimV